MEFSYAYTVLDRLRTYQIEKEREGRPKKIIMIGRAQSHLISKILSKDTWESLIIKTIIFRINYLEKHKEYELSVDEFNQLLKERYYERGIVQIFFKEIEETKKDLEKLKEMFKKEEKGIYDVSKFQEERMAMAGLRNKIQKIIEDDISIKKYFNELKGLEYNKSAIKTGDIIAKIVSGGKLLIKVEGIENIPSRGPCIIAPHHYHAGKDPIAIKAIMKRPIFFMAATETFIISKAYGNFLEKMGTLPYTRDDGGRKRLTPPILKQKVEEYNANNEASIKKAIKHLEHGDAVAIFPEDDAKIFFPTYTRENNQDFIEPKDGFVFMPAYLMKNKGLEVPIIPVGISHKGIVHEFLPTMIKIKFGNPARIKRSEVENLNAKDFRKFVSDKAKEIFETIRKLSIPD